MPTDKPSILRTVIAGIFAHLLIAPAASALILHHNGSLGSAGDGSVNVGIVSDDTAGGLLLGTTFHEVAPHTMLYAFDECEPPVFVAEFAIVNQTPLAWNRMYITLHQGEFLGANGGNLGGPPARSAHPVVAGGIGAEDIAFIVNTGSVGVAGSQILRNGGDSMLVIDFSELVDPGDSFGIAYFANVPEPGQAPQLLMTHSPVAIPEPAGWLLLAGAIPCLLARRPRAA